MLCAYLLPPTLLPVSREAVDDLWESFNDVAEGFGVDVDELKEMLTVLQEPLDLPKKPLADLTERLFIAFDTDNVRGRRIGREAVPGTLTLVL